MEGSALLLLALSWPSDLMGKDFLSLGWLDCQEVEGRSSRSSGGRILYSGKSQNRVQCNGLSPSLSNLIQAMSSPTHSTFQPDSAGRIMARLVLPQALGKAAAT